MVVHSIAALARSVARAGAGALKDDDGGVHRRVLWHDPQAALLAIVTTISHTAVIWILTPFALKFGQSFEAEAPNRCKTARQRNKLSCA